MKTWLVDEDSAVSSSPFCAQVTALQHLASCKACTVASSHTSGASQALAAALTTLDTTERQGCCGHARLGRCKGGVRAAPALGPVSAGLGPRPRPCSAGASCWTGSYSRGARGGMWRGHLLLGWGRTCGMCCRSGALTGWRDCLRAVVSELVRQKVRVTSAGERVATAHHSLPRSSHPRGELLKG